MRSPRIFAFAVVGAAVVAAIVPAFFVQADSNTPALLPMQLECTLPGFAITANPGTCAGTLGFTQIVDTAGVPGPTVGATPEGETCFLEGSTDTLTTHDGSTLTLTTTGMTCFRGTTPVINIRHNAYEVTGGTGRFAGAVGTGDFVVAPGRGNSSVIHIDGNISVQDKD